MPHVLVRFARHAGIVALFIVAAVLGTISGVLFAYSGDLPRISALDEYAPSTITRVHAANGEVIGEFAVQRRVVIGYEDISPTLRQAILAAEDDGFFQHFGLSIPNIVVTLVKDLIYRRTWGASTLTQQLSRKLFLTDEKTWERKVKEALLAVQIEKRYTKQEIFTMYCNQMYFGHGTYGVEAASRLFFGKPAKSLGLEEAALIGGILQGNVRQSPYVNMQAALRRRNYTLDRMAEVGFITREEAEAAKKKPVEVHGEPTQAQTTAPYFLEEVRKHLEPRYGSKQLYESGLSVETSLDVRLQRSASRAIDEGLRRLDKRRGFRRPQQNLAAERIALDGFRDPRWDRPITAGDIVPAVVTGVEASRIQVRIGRYTGAIEREGFAWAGKRAPSALVKPGDVIEARVRALDEAKSVVKATLEQTPVLEGALLAIENRTGRILAMVGGFSFERSKFNRATQAARQVGSAFKPFVYMTAIDRGFTPASLIVDAPVSYPLRGGHPYEPMNYDKEFWGPITLRRALEQSRNIPAVKMMDELGPDQVVRYARRLGLTSPIPPYLAVALGAAEATLVEMTSAYSVFPNQGVRMTPFGVQRVRDREGNVLEENRPDSHDAIRADTAYVMTNLLRGVVLRGTAVRAAELDWPIAGKTGTTDDYTDAWFVGFDPDVTVGVWIGHDQKKSIGNGFTGTEVALPIWVAFMKEYIATRTDRPTFEPPGNIVFVSVDRSSGMPTDPSAPGAISEAFISGTQPVR